MYASLYGIAKTNEMILVLNEKDHINSVFPKLNVLRMKNTAFCEKAELVGEVRPRVYDQRTINLIKRKYKTKRISTVMEILPERRTRD
jgi:hypothetical protein